MGAESRADPLAACPIPLFTPVGRGVGCTGLRPRGEEAEMSKRPKLSYANVVATLALFLVLTGGTVYAASKLGKDEVKSKNIAKGAVKNSDLAKNSVKGKNIKAGSVATSDLTADLLCEARHGGDRLGRRRAGDRPHHDHDQPAPADRDDHLHAGCRRSHRDRRGGQVHRRDDEHRAAVQPGCPAARGRRADADLRQSRERGELTHARLGAGPRRRRSLRARRPRRDAHHHRRDRGDTDCTPATQLDKVEVRVIQIR